MISAKAKRPEDGMEIETRHESLRAALKRVIELEADAYRALEVYRSCLDKALPGSHSHFVGSRVTAIALADYRALRNQVNALACQVGVL